MANINCTVYFREHGSSKIYAVEKAKGRVGSYGIRWYEGDRQRQKIIGQYPAPVAAKLKKELELKKARQKATSIRNGTSSEPRPSLGLTIIGRKFSRYSLGANSLISTVYVRR